MDFGCDLFPGQPVAWAITDVENTHTYHEFFKAVKSRVPDAIIDTLMTDDGNYFLNDTTTVYDI